MTGARKEPGRVHLVGGGPGDPGLITSRGLELLRSADVVVHDRLIGPELLREARADAELIDVGKGPGHAPYRQEEINRLLVDRARLGRTVVRLKGGDPFVFGRGSEEAAACREAGVPVYVVPGVSSAIAAPAAAGIPVTARGLARSFAVVTAQRAGRTGEVDDWRAGRRRYPRRADGPGQPRRVDGAAHRGGARSGDAGRLHPERHDGEQRVTRATLATIADAADRDGLENPVVTVIGAVAALGDAEIEASGAMRGGWRQSGHRQVAVRRRSPSSRAKRGTFSPSFHARRWPAGVSCGPMRAMVLERARAPLVARELDRPGPAPGQVLLRVRACAVCRTDLHVVDGELAEPKLPLVLGHEIVATVEQRGQGVTRFAPGDRVGVPWLGSTCGLAGSAARPGEPVRSAPFHRLHARRRLCRIRHRRRRAMLPHSPAILRLRGGSADVCRAHRVPRVEAAAMGAARHLRLRRRRAHRRPARR